MRWRILFSAICLFKCMDMTTLFCSGMRNCEPYNEVSKETLNPHYLLQHGTVQFNDEEYKS